MKEGKAPLRTFGDLQQFIAMQEPKAEPPAAKPEPAVAETAAASPAEENKNGQTTE